MTIIMAMPLNSQARMGTYALWAFPCVLQHLAYLAVKYDVRNRLSTLESEGPSKLAIFFPEGPGYLYVEFLGRGVGGVVVKVRSLADGKLYVRKKPVPSLPNDAAGMRNPEVSLYRSHPNIPRLIHAQHFTNVRGTMKSTRRYYALYSFPTIGRSSQEWFTQKKQLKAEIREKQWELDNMNKAIDIAKPL